MLPGARERLFSAEVFFGLTGSIPESTGMRSAESANTCPTDNQMSINKNFQACESRNEYSLATAYMTSMGCDGDMRDKGGTEQI